MGRKDTRIDAYIAKQRDFAKPIFTYIREVVHEGCPQVEETLKWNSPTFMHHGILCGFAGFKEHAVFGFWKHELLVGPRRDDAVGSYGRITSIEDLPPKKQLLSLVKKAMELNETDAKAPRMAKRPRKAISMPADLEAALAKNKAAKAKYEDFSPSHRHEYLEWITDAKSDDTRARRVKQAVEWMAEGKPRNWKNM